MFIKRIFYILSFLVMFYALVNTHYSYAEKAPTSILSKEIVDKDQDVYKKDKDTLPLAKYKLGPADKIRVTIFNERDLSGVYTINEKSILSMPLVGEINVRDKTVFDVKNILVQKFSDGYLKDPSIAIEIDEFRSVFIIGEVREPGSYEYMFNMTILNAVAVAGGFTYRAKKNEVEVMREVDGESVVMEDIEIDEIVRPGDIILVKERFF